jgi:XRE family transcriptional regulator, regulator of sulfur utilization
MSSRRERKMSERPEIDMAPGIGKTIQRLRKAYNMSLGDLSEQSGVAKSIISQIERNETNPTIATVWRLSRALDVTMSEVLKADTRPNFVQHQRRYDIPILESQDGLCRLAIFGPLDLVEYMQWYDFSAEPGGILESEPHQPGCTEHLYILEGEIEVTCDGDVKTAKAGEALRYRGDRAHRLRNIGDRRARATMIMVLTPPAEQLAR